ncbi:hypothetical protein CDAR_433851 [Caerostris darwini]|uniref:Uncharacterized protein n=1 Tax=Caerostris darwini TaxID=1538125 RepID=A0AAV4SWV7_9ARAC|nr:hypothetical protein CDAR_433851 [Caerostris darwini]
MKMMKKGRNRQKMAQIRAEEAARFEDDCCDHVMPLQICFVLNSITQSGSEDVDEKQQISVKYCAQSHNYQRIPFLCVIICADMFSSD